jgi:hypothetical protein
MATMIMLMIALALASAKDKEHKVKEAVEKDAPLLGDVEVEFTLCAI